MGIGEYVLFSVLAAFSAHLLPIEYWKPKGWFRSLAILDALVQAYFGEGAINTALYRTWPASYIFDSNQHFMPTCIPTVFKKKMFSLPSPASVSHMGVLNLSGLGEKATPLSSFLSFFDWLKGFIGLKVLIGYLFWDGIHSEVNNECDNHIFQFAFPFMLLVLCLGILVYLSLFQ